MPRCASGTHVSSGTRNTLSANELECSLGLRERVVSIWAAGILFRLGQTLQSFALGSLVVATQTLHGDFPLGADDQQWP